MDLGNIFQVEQMELIGLDAGCERMKEVKDDFLVYKLING